MPRFSLFLIVLSLLAGVTSGVLLASGRCQFPDALNDEPSDVQTYQQFLKVLLSNPRFGTAWDRVYEFHSNQGTLHTFHDALADVAGLPQLKAADASATEAMIPQFTPTPDPGKSSVLVGMLDLQHVQGASAVAALEHAVLLRPENPIANWYLGKARVMNRQLDAAPEAFESAIACRPAKTDLLEIYKELARTLHRSQQDARALAAWQQLENLFPGDLRVREQIAMALAQDGRWQDALARYEAMASESKDPDQRVQANLAASDLMIQLGKPQDAIALLESQLGTLDGDSWLHKEIRRRIEATFRGRDDLAGLAEYYKNWIRQHPDDVDAMARLGRTCSLLNNPTEASEWYRKAIELAPTNVAIRESLIEQLVRDDQLSDAIIQYEQTAEFDAGNLDHIEAWGQLYLSNKNLPLEERRLQAAVVWERLLVNRGDDPVTIARLASLLRRVDLQNRAIALYQSAIAKAPNDPQYREYLGEYLHQLQRTDEALNVWEGIAAGERRSKANLIRLAEVLNRFGQINDALSAMREACGMNPDPAERIQFAQMLREAAGRTEVAGNAETAQPAMNSDQRLPHTKLKSAPEVLANPQQLARSGLLQLFTEAFEQLDLAEQSAETTDERQMILRERIKTLIAAGTLEQQTNLLATELKSGTNVTAERWRTLALYQDAAEELNDAIVSAMRVVELEPRSIPGWTILADLYERTGQLGDAADAMKKLTTLDRRGISEYLRKIARFEIRLGHFDTALKTGREVINATPGDPEAYQFFADLAFEVGQPQAAVDALRQAVRVNPGDEASLRALAKTLADEFQTPEAIDLYWRAFDKAQDLESQINIVVALTNLYLRSDQFLKLIERLELRSRELNLPSEMTRCIATAYREAGEFRKASDTLERLMADDSKNVSLLKELAVLAEQEHNISRVAQYQQQLVQLTNSDQDRRRYIELLSQVGLYDEAAAARQRLAESQTDRAQILKEIEILVSSGYDDLAATLCQRLLDSSKDDWEALNSYRGILLRNHQLAEARDISRRIVQRNLDFDVPATSADGSGHSVHHSALTNDTAATFSDWLMESTENPAGSFGAVYCDCAVSLLFRVGASPSQADIDSIFRSQLSERDQLRLGAFVTRSVTVRTPASPEVWTALETFLQGNPGPARTAVQLFETCQRFAANDLVADGQQRLRLRSLQLLTSILAESPDWLNQSGLPILTLLPVDGVEKEIDAIVRQQLAAEHSIQELRALWLVAESLQSSSLQKQMFSVWHRLLIEKPASAAELETAISDLDLGFSPDAGRQSPFWNDPEALISFLDFFATLGSSVERTDQQSPSTEFLTLPELLVDQLGETAGSNLSACLQLLVSLHAEDQVVEWYRTKIAVTPAAERFDLSLILAELARQLSDDVAETASLIDAAESSPQNNDIRFLIAHKAARLGAVEEAVLVLDSMTLIDGPRQIAREEFVLRHLLPLGRNERCMVAADRLFGLPLNTDQQRDLIPILDQLGMRDKVTAIQARFGRGSIDRQSILGRQLETSVAQGKNELAGEVAWELLKLASGGSLFSGHRPDDDRDDGGERLQAMKALGRLNRLQPLIDRYESMLAASPGSVELLEILAEFHDAAEQWDLLTAKRDRIALLSRKSPPSLKAKAVELERIGDVSGACDLYLTVLKEDPTAFSAEMETYVQAFERAKRHAEFLTAVLNLKSEYWSDHAGLIINIIAELAHAKTDDGVVQKSIAKLLATQKTRRLTIGSFLARRDIIQEDQLLDAMRLEIEVEARVAWSASFNEISLIIRELKQPAYLQTVSNSLIDQIRAGGVGVPGAQLLAAYIDARLGYRDAMVKRLEECLTGTATRPELRHLVMLNLRLKELGANWNDDRLWLLEQMAKLVGDDKELADSVLEELGTVYQTLGRMPDSRAVLNLRVQQMLNSAGPDQGNSSDSIRALLQAGEKIQHSGFPIEGARLLLNVTPHDIDEFTSDLDDDKAVAFKSRFNASQRWARQQIGADQLVAWFDLVVRTFADARATSELDLLLELTGTTDPRCHDEATLHAVRMDSAILTAITKQSFEDEKQRLTLTANIRSLLVAQNPPPSLLTASLGFAMRLDDDRLIADVIGKLNALVAAASDGTRNAVEQSSILKIPAALRSAPDLSVIFAAKMLLQLDAASNIIEQLLQLATDKAKVIDNRLVRIAVLNEGHAVAKQAGLTQFESLLEMERDAVVAEQIHGASISTPALVDIRHEIRTRLLIP